MKTQKSLFIIFIMIGFMLSLTNCKKEEFAPEKSNSKMTVKSNIKNTTVAQQENQKFSTLSN